jgi:hypothetical protein
VIGNEQAPVSTVVAEVVFCVITGSSALAIGAKATARPIAAPNTTRNDVNRFI